MRLTTSVYLMGTLLVGLASAASADVITDWNEKVVNASLAAQQPPPVQARNIAMVHLAMFDALDSIEPRYTPYRMQLQVPNTTSREAAASAAAHYLMVRLYPDKAKDFDAALQAAVASVQDRDAKTQGVQLGEKVAAAMLQIAARTVQLRRTPIVPTPLPGRMCPPRFPPHRIGALLNLSR
jgi:hypothetical protein